MQVRYVRQEIGVSREKKGDKRKEAGGKRGGDTIGEIE